MLCFVRISANSKNVRENLQQIKKRPSKMTTNQNRTGEIRPKNYIWSPLVIGITNFTVDNLIVWTFLSHENEANSQGWNYVLIRRQDPLENNSPVGKELSLDRRTTTGHWGQSGLSHWLCWGLRVIEDFAFSNQRNFFRIPPYCKLSLSGETPGRQSMPPTGISG